MESLFLSIKHNKIHSVIFNFLKEFSHKSFESLRRLKKKIRLNAINFFLTDEKKNKWLLTWCLSFGFIFVEFNSNHLGVSRSDAPKFGPLCLQKREKKKEHVIGNSLDQKQLYANTLSIHFNLYSYPSSTLLLIDSSYKGELCLSLLVLMLFQSFRKKKIFLLLLGSFKWLQAFINNLLLKWGLFFLSKACLFSNLVII